MKELLKDAGLTDAQLAAAIAAHDTKIKDAYVPLSRFNEVNEELKAEKVKVTERDTQLSSLKSVDAEGLKAEIAQLKADNKAKDTAAAEMLETDRKKNAVKFAWLEDAEYKPYDIDEILEKTDLTKIELDERGGIKTGLKEQRDSMVKERAWAFEKKTTDETKKKPNSKPVGNEPPDGDKGGTGGGALSLGAMAAKRGSVSSTKVKTLEDINPFK